MSATKTTPADMYYKIGYLAPSFCGVDKLNSPPTPSCWPDLSCSTKGVSLCKYPNNQFQARLFYPRYNCNCNYVYYLN